MKGRVSTIGYIEAQTMLDAFASVGTVAFDLTCTDCSGEKVSFRRGVCLADLTRTMPAMLDTAPASQHNIIVRPHAPAATLIQLADVRAIDRLAPAVFLALETS